MSKHTPTPWRVEHDPEDGAIEVYSDGETARWVADCCCDSDVDLANAAHIVKCVNAHDELVSLVRDAHHASMLAYSKLDANTASEVGRVIDRARAILAKVETE